MDWERYLLPTLFNCWCPRNAATHMPPSRAVLGYTLRRLGNQNLSLLDDQDLPPLENQPSPERRRHWVCIIHRQQQYQLRHAGAKVLLPIVPGQRVLTRDHPAHGNPFSYAYEGPHAVVRRVGHNTYLVKKVHRDEDRSAPDPNEEDRINLTLEILPTLHHPGGIP